jgi:glycerol kinase
MNYMLTIDQSTSGTKALLVDANGRISRKSSLSHTQNYPEPGWVEQDAEQIWQNVLTLIQNLPVEAGVPWKNILGLAITNQRETTVIWDRLTGQPLTPAVSWQCQRGKAICDELVEHAEAIRSKTGLSLSAYYPASKATWLLRNTPGLFNRAADGDLCIGTIDSYLIFRLTGCEVFATDLSNASRTQLFNLDDLDWDEDITDWFNIPKVSLPKINPSDQIFGLTQENILPVRLPIAGVMGDSHAALFGQGCVHQGMAKATYGTGSSIMMNVGNERTSPPAGIAASLAWGWRGQINYVLEGNVTSSGDTLKWLCDELELVETVQEIDELAEKVKSTEGVYLVPAFAGLGAPYFDSLARAAIIGLTRGSRKVHVARAALESIAFQNLAVIEAMGAKLSELRVDGGPTRSPVLMQFQADLIQCPVSCSIYQEISALGAAYMGGLTLGLYAGLEGIAAIKERGHVYNPLLKDEEIGRLKDGWLDAVSRVRTNIMM